jgi:hypothetical protein
MSFISAGRDGAFALPNVLPGDYYVVAIRGVTATDWRDPEVLDALAPLFTRIAVIDAGTLPVTLTVQ